MLLARPTAAAASVGSGLPDGAAPAGVRAIAATAATCAVRRPQHAVQLHGDRDRFEAAGLRLVVIGQGTPAHALEFKARNHVDGLEMLVDESRASYDAAGAKVATVSELIGPRVAAKGAVGAL